MAELVVEALLSSSFQVIFERLASVDIRDYFGGNKLDKLVKELVIELNSINHVLEEAEIKQYQNTHVKKWLDELKHVVYEAEQILDEIDTDAMLKKMKAESEPVTTNVLGFFSSLTTNPYEYRINELLEKLELLATQTKRLGLEDGPCAGREGLVSWKPSKRLITTALVDESSIFGRDVHKGKLVKFLLEGNDSGNQVPIISIVGLGGMGKTTLAKLVYNDEKIKEHFKLEAWVYVSESFDVVGLTKTILKSFNSSPDGEDLNLLQHQLQHLLSGKQYLLVLDDIWNGNAECWEQLLLPFNHGSSGSKIIVTTREKEVAHVLNSTLFDLEQLDKSDCWSLFVTHAFHGKNVGDYPNLESIGKKIVNKCGGLPLAVKTLGQLLRKKFSEHEWRKILETDMWRLSDEANNINPVLRLSYHNLPSNRKRCFAYCSLLRKGWAFNKGDLIKFWMADDLLKCCGADKSEEELGSDIFDDLESISFFQSFYDAFVMHDLVNDLAKSVSGEFCMQIEGSRVEGIPERTRHICLSLQSNCGDKLLESICEHKGLRSLIVECSTATLICNNVQRDLFSRLTCLRMLSFRYCGLSELVDEICNLKLLRYLDLSYNNFTSLPDTICMLYNLQTLLLEGCKMTELPSNFSKLVNLCYLELPFDHEGPCIKKMSNNIGKLNNLQALPYFVVDGSDLKEFEKLNHLHGEIHIKSLGNVIDSADAVTANLKDKKYLEKLHMEFDGRREEMDDLIVESNVSVLEALQPNSNLKSLIISHYNGNSFPNWLRGCHLSNLVSLELQNCGLCSHLPSLGQLHCLKELSISHCDGIKIIGEEFYDNNSTILPFRSLEVLIFYEMKNWEEWLCPEGFSLLKKLSIKKCPELKRVTPQHLPSLQKLEIDDCNKLEECLCLEGFPLLEELSIKNCPELKRITPQDLPSLQKLEIYGCNKLEEWLCLEGFPLLEELSITNCPELKRVMPKHLPSLQKLEISDCNKLEEWLCLEGFPLLKELSIERCPKLKKVLPQHLPLIQMLKIKDCKMLEASIPKSDNIIELEIQNCDRVSVNELPTSLKKFVLFGNRCMEFSMEQNLVNSTILEVLVLDFRGFIKCPFLNLCCYNSLSRLHIKGWCSPSFPFELHLFTNLRYLWLYDFPQLESFPRGSLPTNLRELVITNFPKLVALREDWNLFQFDYLFLYDCPELESLFGGGLPSHLRDLRIHNCPKLIALREEQGLFQLNSLEVFVVSDHEFENVEFFPEENLLPPTLENLELQNCSKLRTMNYKGFLHLNSLKSLYIVNCPSLESLPEEALPSTLCILYVEDCPILEGLPEEGLPSSLSRLRIYGCPLLKEKYQKEGGVRWHTISHIPSVEIDSIKQK
ncbi:hypothetical protein TSUD_34390 [Trifolium subterraneum]|uniref:LRR and NB-ARC domain disease resistance protein n=1 Tax=Trifolium subterraneum TaxID=3900 RepID=A0A2Z6P3J6_TRISU|nr:hypothetical protein TSUD_34390 [Trifolium subterraneum]